MSNRFRIHALALGIVLFLHAGFITYWTWRPIGPEVRNSAYDSLGLHLLQGSSEVDEGTIEWESFKIDGRSYIYFGAFPALIRILPNLVFPEITGMWPRVSCLLASLTAMLAFAGIVSLITQRNRGGVFPAGYFVFFSILGFGLGTPLLYLMSCGRIYHEAILWGLAGSTAALYFIVKLASGSGVYYHNLFFFSFWTAATLLARVTFGIPLCLIALFLFIAGLVRTPRDAGTGRIATSVFGAFLPLGIGLLFQAWYNIDRFGSIFSFIDYSHFYIHPEEIGGGFNIARIPSSFAAYFSPFRSYFQLRFPYVRMLNPQYFINEIFFHWREPVLPLTLGSLWLLIPGTWGLVLLARSKGEWLLKVSAAAFLVEALLILTYFFVTQRFASEFIPIFLTGSIVFFSADSSRVDHSWRFVSVYILLVIISAAVTCFGTLYWLAHSNGDGPAEYKNDLLRMMYPETLLSPLNKRKYPVTLENALKVEFDNPMGDMAFDGSSLALRAQIFPHGIGVNSPGKLTISVPPDAVGFKALVGISDGALGCGDPSADIRITGPGGEELFSTGIMRQYDPPKLISVDVKGLNVITLEVGDGGDLPDCDHVNIAMPGFD